MSGVNFVVSLLLARFLGLEVFGLYAVFMLVIIFAQGISNSLVSIPFLSLVHKAEIDDTHEEYVLAVLFMQLIISAATMFLVLFVFFSIDSWYVQYDLSSYALGLALSIGVSFLHDFTRRRFFADGNFRAVFFNDSIAYIGLLLSVLVIGLAGELTINQIFIFKTFWFGIACLVAWRKINIKRASKSVFLQTILAHWTFGKWLLAKVILQFMGQNYLVLAAGAMMGVTAVGALKAAQSIVGVLHILFLALENLLPSKASKAYAQKGINGLREILKQAYILGGSATLLLLLPIVIWSSAWISFFGEEYRGYGYLLQLYSCHYFVVFVGLPMRIALRTFEDTRTIFLSYLFMAIVSAVGGNFIVTIWGLSGVVYGLMILQLLMYVCFLSVLIPRFRPIK